MVVISMILAVAGLVAVALRPRSGAAAAAALCCAAAALAAGAAPAGLLASAAGALGPLAAFLVATIWLSAFAERAGLAVRLARRLERRAGGSRARLFALVCALCAAVTATVSLDGAVVLMVPVLLALRGPDEELTRPLLLGTIGVANAFSLAVPQGNPTNLIVMQHLGLGPAEFVARLFVPALLATGTCVAAVAFAQRRALRGAYRRATAGGSAPWSGAERVAAAGLATAGLLGAAAPWAGIPGWAPVCAVAAVVAVLAAVAGLPRPAASLPVRVCAQVGALVVLVGSLAATGPASLSAALPTALSSSPPWAGSLAAVVGLALAAGVVACVVNNLPASVVMAGALGAGSVFPTVPACAALAGLSVGALGTPHGSVATLLALDRAGEGATGVGGARDLRLWMPAAAGATALAATALWALS